MRCVNVLPFSSQRRFETSRSYKELNELGSRYVQKHVPAFMHCPLFWSNFNQHRNVLTNFSNIPQYQSSWKCTWRLSTQYRVIKKD